MKGKVLVICVVVVIGSLCWLQCDARGYSRASRGRGCNNTALPNNTNRVNGTRNNQWSGEGKLNFLLFLWIGLSLIYMFFGCLNETREDKDACLAGYLPYILSMMTVFGFLPLALSLPQETNDIGNQINRINNHNRIRPTWDGRNSWRIIPTTEINEGFIEVGEEYDDDEYYDEEAEERESEIVSLQNFGKNETIINNKEILPSIPLACSGSSRATGLINKVVVSFVGFGESLLVTAIGDVQVGPSQLIPDFPEDKMHEYFIILGLIATILLLLVIGCCMLKSFL